VILLKAKNIGRKWDDKVFLHGIDFEIHEGEFVCLIGAGNSGKSGLLRAVNRTEPPDTGEIWFKGKNIVSPEYNVEKLRQEIGMVYVEDNLFPIFTVAENIMRPQMDVLRRTPAEAYNKAIELLEWVGLSEYAEMYPEVLTDGQRQRVSIIRALAMEPDVILLDEPTSALAPTMVDEVLAVIREMSKIEITIIMATHEMEFVKEMADQVFFMVDGTIHERGTPDEIFNSPIRARTRYFINRYRFLELKINSRKFDVLGFITEINVFALRQMVPGKMLNKIQHIFEELCINILLKWKDIPIELIIGYDSRNGQCEMRLSYEGGMKYDPMEDGVCDEDDFALTILRAMIKSYEYNYVGSKNKITMFF